MAKRPPPAPPSIRVRVAGPDDRALVLEILDQAARRMAGYGNVHGWPVPFPPGMIDAPLSDGCVHLVARADGTNVATVTLLWEDPRVWGPQPPVAGYVHRLAVRPAHAGAGYGAAILEWADAEIRRRGRTLLRLDTATTNTGLVAYYRALEFAVVGEADQEPLRFPVTLFERPVVRAAGGP